MKTGIELIAAERQEQIEKHGRTVESDLNQHGLIWMVEWLIQAGKFSDEAAKNAATTECPYNLDEKILFHMFKKPPKEKLIIAGALIAAEIDRLQAQNE